MVIVLIRYTLVIALLLLSSITSTAGEFDRFGLAFPPIKDTKQMNFTLPHLKALQVREIRYTESWKHREPEKGKFSWSTLDERMRFVADNDLSLMLTIQAEGPDWACAEYNEKSCLFRNEDDFRNYVRRLLLRYPDTIARIQFGNEWDIKDNYAGSAEDYVRFNNILYEETKRFSKETEVVLGGVTRVYPICIAVQQNIPLSFDNLALKDAGIVEQHLQNIAAKSDTVIPRVEHVLHHAQYDLVDIHLYDDCENWEHYLAVINNRTDKPVIVSEFGGPHPEFEVYSEAYQADRLKQYLKTLQTPSIKSAYYFKLVDTDDCEHTSSGLINTNLEMKKGYDVFKHRHVEEENEADTTLLFNFLHVIHVGSVQ